MSLCLRKRDSVLIGAGLVSQTPRIWNVGEETSVGREGQFHQERETAASRKGAVRLGSAGSCPLLLRNRIVCSLWIEQVCEHAVTVNVEKKKKKPTKESRKDNGGWQCLHIHALLAALGFSF